MADGPSLSIDDMRIDLTPGRRVVLRGSWVCVHIEAGLRGSFPGNRTPDPVYSPLEVWMWDNRDRVFDEAERDPTATWREVALRAGAPAHRRLPLRIVTQATVAATARLGGRAYPYRVRL